MAIAVLLACLIAIVAAFGLAALLGLDRHIARLRPVGAWGIAGPGAMLAGLVLSPAMGQAGTAESALALALLLGGIVAMAASACSGEPATRERPLSSSPSESRRAA